MGGLNLTPMVKNLLLLNIGVFLIQQLNGPFMDHYMALHVFQCSIFQPWQLFTNIFMHANTLHIFFNMFGLITFGSVLETFWGSNRFLIYYMACGLGASVIQNGITSYEIQQAIANYQGHVDPNILDQMISPYTLEGASGAIMGLLLAFGMLFPNTELMMMFLPIPIKAKYFVLIYGAFELFMGTAKFQGDNIAHFAHLGGMIIGFILIKYWQKQRKSFY